MTKPIPISLLWICRRVNAVAFDYSDSESVRPNYRYPLPNAGRQHADRSGWVTFASLR